MIGDIIEIERAKRCARIAPGASADPASDATSGDSPAGVSLAPSQEKLADAANWIDRIFFAATGSRALRS